MLKSNKKKKNLICRSCSIAGNPCQYVMEVPALQKKQSDMKTDYETLCSAIMESSISEMQMDFSLLCRSAGVDRVRADNFLYESFGMSGQEIMRNLYAAKAECRGLSGK